MSARWVILGAGGQVGRAWTSLLGTCALPLSRVDVDLSQAQFLSSLEAKIAAEKPTVIINAAAYTQVDQAEGVGNTEAFRVNAEAVGELASWCAAKKIPLVHYSTDYVFDGSGHSARNESAETHPLNAYGQSKLAGEKAMIASGANYLILRTSWVYDAQGKNFFNTMLRLFSEKEQVNVVDDQMGAPTYAPQLVSASYKMVKKALEMTGFPRGIYHLCHRGETSWHGFAQAIFALARTRDSRIRCTQVNPIPSSAYPTLAMRPRNSRLDCTKTYTQFLLEMPRWEEGLQAAMDEKYGR